MGAVINCADNTGEWGLGLGLLMGLREGGLGVREGLCGPEMRLSPSPKRWV